MCCPPEAGKKRMKNAGSDDDFKKLLGLYLKGRLSGSQKAQIEKQLDEFKKQDPTPYEFTQAHSDELWKKISAETIDKPRRSGRIWISVAAAVLFASTSVMLILSWNHDATQLSNKVILQDGTIVWLKDGARLDYSQLSLDNREVTLSGEALFEVARMRERPFMIHCGHYNASVLGTSFNIKSNDSTVELTVLTGTVKLSSLRTDSTVLVNQHEHVVFADNLVSKTVSDPETVKTVVANTQYDMHFEDTRMEEVVRRIEGKFDVNVDLQTEDIGTCMISADFTDQSLPLTLSMISEALGFQYQIDDDHVTITGTGCHE